MVSGSSVPAQPTAHSMPESESCIRRLDKNLPQVISQDEVSTDNGKYTVLTTFQEVVSVSKTAQKTPAMMLLTTGHPYIQLNQYWAKVMAMRTAAGDLKYKTLGKVVNGRPGTVTWKC